MPDANKAHRMQIVNQGSTLYVLGQRHAQFAETELAKSLADLSIEFSPTTTPQVNFKQEKAINKALYTALNDNNGEGLAQAFTIFRKVVCGKHWLKWLVVIVTGHWLV